MNVIPMGRSFALIVPSQFSLSDATEAAYKIFCQELVGSLILPESGVVLYKIKVGDVCHSGYLNFQTPNNNQVYLCESVQNYLDLIPQETTKADSYEVCWAIAGISANKSYIFRTCTRKETCGHISDIGPSGGEADADKFHFLSQKLYKMFSIKVEKNFEIIP
jgi:hypothetical protein